MGCKTGAPSVVNSDTYAKIAEAVIARGPVNRQGEQTVQNTGNLHPYVDVLTGPRISRNSFTRLPNGKYQLTYGFARQILDGMDATGSFRSWFPKTFQQMGLLNGMAQILHPEDNIQSSGAFVQDFEDYLKVGGRSYDRQVALMQTMYEADAAKLAAQFQQLMGSGGGGDEPEDYQLFLAWLLWGNEADSIRYGLMPDVFLTADQIARDNLDPDIAYDQLGIQVPSMTTKQLGHLVVQKTNFFYLYVRNNLTDPVATWWKNVLGKGRVIPLSDAMYGAAMKAALMFVTHNENPSRTDVINFLVKAGGSSNYPLSASVAGEIFDAIVGAEVVFGTQVPKIKLPKRGDIFDHYRNPFPIGHDLYQPYSELGLPDPELGLETPFTSIFEAKPAFDLNVVSKKTGQGKVSVVSYVASDAIDSDDSAGDSDEQTPETFDWSGF